MKKIWLNIAIVSTAIIFVGCGGGSSSPAVATASSTLNGIAVDELILNGKVKVSNPTDGSLLVEGRTSSTDGTYSLAVKGYTGIVVVNVTCDANSKIKVGAVEEACPAQLDLNSVIAVENGAAPITVNISPLTEIVYQKAKTLGLSVDDINSVLNQVSVMFGVNPMKDNPTLDTYDKVIQAFHAVAKNSNKSIFDVINNFVADFADNNISNSKALIDAMKNANVTTLMTENSGTTGYIVSSNTTSLSLQALVGSLRTQGNTVKEYVDGSTGNQGEARVLGDSMDNLALDIQLATDYVLGLVDMVRNARNSSQTQLTDVIKVNYTNVPATVTQSTTNVDNWSYSIEFGGNKYTGTITLPSLPDGIENTFSLALSASMNGEVPYEGHIGGVYTLQPQTVSLDNITLTKAIGGANFIVSNLSLKNTQDDITLDELKGSLSYDTTDITSIKIDDIKLSANIGDYKAKGVMNLSSYVANSTLDKYLKNIPTKLTFNGSLKNTKTMGEINGTIDIELRNGATVNLSSLDNVDEKIDMKVAISGTLKMPLRPITILNLTYETDVTDDTKRHNYTGSYSHSSSLVTLSGITDKSTNNSKLVFTSGNIVATFILVNGSLVDGSISNSTGSLVTSNGNIIASIEDRGNDVLVIKYLDGYVESIL